jgi:hypothetical protein
MCLIVDKEKFKIEIAQEDIVVYKVLEKYRRFVESPCQGFVYEIGKEYKTRMKPFFNRYYCKITEGFHSFLNEEDAKIKKRRIQMTSFSDKSLHLCCFRCIIPKGSNVVYGKYEAKDAVVSEAIKIIEEV